MRKDGISSSKNGFQQGRPEISGSMHFDVNVAMTSKRFLSCLIELTLLGTNIMGI